MNRRTLGRIGMLSLMLGVSTVACTTGTSHVASLADQAPKAKEVAAKSADKARAALAAHKGLVAVAAAEQAVSLSPNDAGYRMLLGQSYLAAGRFASAATSFRDSLTLNPDQPKAKFNMALAEIAQGQAGEAQSVLHSLDGQIPVADLGLALALSGDRQTAINTLSDYVRSGKSDARARQNLALAFALNGQWREARGVAMQDTPPNQINDQIAHWAELATPQAAGPVQVASMLGVKPASDPGLPTALALAAPAPGEAPVALAAADPAPAAMPAQVAANDAPSVTVPLDDAPKADATPADAPAAAVVLAAQHVSAPEPEAATPALLRAPKTPFRSAVLSVQPKPAFRSSGYVVQLGAFSRAGAIQTAWDQASKAMPRLAGYAPARAQFSFSGASLVRLSVSGFADREAAVALCEQIHAKGSACFVRATAGDAPLQWVKADAKTQTAKRDVPVKVAAKAGVPPLLAKRDAGVQVASR
ncbi:SPOR domain-containing protein [Sphingomonas sp. CGMCC 1.13654]|uniref:SPOR domain-containing protein n=1 Tax=Sphingomonas chungangi TaxID=2683589 RepID=A0A838LCP3_9SPHN|nr:SPOR domain-containing protein [Sphingomonas chungangi]MBA2936505.1 SPOR domain-containing protein [Sphingomonas chungangi]MVW55890.1 tetratricopeptide repeat protein [Sphingomonas chungangi]